jgi:hypothetical protein
MIHLFQKFKKTLSLFRSAAFAIISATAVVGLSSALSPAKAQFSGSYAPSNWTTTRNAGATGSVDTSGAPSSISITGSDGGSSTSKTIQFTTQAQGSGTYSFNWTFLNTDIGGPGYDNPNFVTNGTSTLFSNYNRFGLANQNGSQAYVLAAGDTFGFEVDAVDNFGGPGILGISNFLYTAAAPTGLAYSSTLQPYADMQSIGLDSLKNQRELVLNQAGDCDQRGWVVYDSNNTKTSSKTKKHQSLCIFAEGGNATGTINGTGSLGGYNTANASSAYGLEWKASKQWTIGAAYGYGSTNLSNFNFQDTSASIGSTINSGALYGVYRPDKQQRWKIGGLFGYSGFSYTGSRSYLGDAATSAYNSSGYTGALQASYDIPLTTDYNNQKNPLSPVHIKPMLGLAYGSHQQDGFAESGAGTLVNVQGQTTNSLLGTVGVSLDAPIALNQKKTTVLVPRIGVAYQVDFLADQDGNRSITASLQDDATTSYNVLGQNRGSSNLLLNLGADLQLNPKTVLYAGVNYQAFNTGDQFGYQGGLKYKF